jgi:hypothetical protein
MVSGAKQLEALTLVIRRVSDAGARAGLTMVHQPPPGAGGASGGARGGGGDGAAGADAAYPFAADLPSIEAAAHPETVMGGGAGGGGGGGSAWKPRNTLVRGVLREVAQSAARDQERAGQESARRGGKYV